MLDKYELTLVRVSDPFWKLGCEVDVATHSLNVIPNRLEWEKE